MKKFLKTTTALAFAALVATSSLMVYGAGNYTLKVEPCSLLPELRSCPALSVK